jgi:HEAT repeat protein
MRRPPAPNDFDGWVHHLGVSSRRKDAKIHLLAAGKAALPALRRGLQNAKPMVRRQVVNVLDHLVDDETLPHLVALLDDDDAEVVGRVLHALACDRCKQDECRPGEDLWVPRALVFARSHPSAHVRARAIDALSKVAGRRPHVLAALADVVEREGDIGLRGLARHAVEQGQRSARRIAATA